MTNLTNNPSWQVNDEHQPQAFHFKVVFSDASGTTDLIFEEVSGLNKEIITDDIEETGGDGFAHRIPKSLTHPTLLIKRGIAPVNSPLVLWCKSILNSVPNGPICCMPIMVYLMDEQQKPIRGWEFTNAYPIKWLVESFEPSKNEVSIETIEFEYQTSSRIF